MIRVIRVMRAAAAWMAILCLRGMAQEPACAIRGTVVDEATKQPVVRARVIAEVPGSYSFVRLTDETGRFCFAVLSPAAYHVSAQKAGYAESRRDITLTAEEPAVAKPLELPLTQYASLAGVVVDEAGEPLPGVNVEVWERVHDRNGGSPSSDDSAISDGRGAFRFSELAPGTYYLSVKPEDEWQETRYVSPFMESKGETPHEKEVETFYSGSFTFAGATPVELKAGQQVDNLVLTPKKTALRRLSGRIANPPPESAVLWLEHETETGSGSSGVVAIGADGSFARAGLAPARYTLRLSEGQRLFARKLVDLTGGDAAGITLEPVETVDVPVTFRTEGKGPAFRPPVGICGFLEEDGSDDAVMGLGGEDGACRFKSVVRGVYRVNISLGERPLYVKRMVYGGEAQADRTLDLRHAATGVLEVTLSPNVAEVQGRAEGEDVDGVTVLLVDGVRIAAQAETDQKGRFRMEKLAPGKYRLFAISEFDEDEWGSPDLAKALAGKSLELELKESEKKQVKVKVIPEEEWDAAVQKHGG